MVHSDPDSMEEIYWRAEQVLDQIGMRIGSLVQALRNNEAPRDIRVQLGALINRLEDVIGELYKYEQNNFIPRRVP